MLMSILPLYKCPECGRIIEVSKEGVYYCKLCLTRVEPYTPPRFAITKPEIVKDEKHLATPETLEEMFKEARKELWTFWCPHCNKVIKKPLGRYTCKTCNKEMMPLFSFEKNRIGDVCNYCFHKKTCSAKNVICEALKEYYSEHGWTLTEDEEFQNKYGWSVWHKLRVERTPSPT